MFATKRFRSVHRRKRWQNYDRLEIPQLGTAQTFLASDVANCTNYSMLEPPVFYDEPVDSDIPMLILRGELDVRTPLAYSETPAEDLTTETLIVVPENGHETSSSICVKSLISVVLADPAASLDTACYELKSPQESRGLFAIMGWFGASIAGATAQCNLECTFTCLCCR